MSFTYGTMFTGIGGFDLGLDHAGGECAWMFEKDDRARAVLRKQWPNTQIYDDAQEKIANLQPVDVLAFGSPCQDVSVAGERAGLLGAQSGLFFEGWRVTRQTKPRVVVFENVPGLLSSHEGRDFAVVLGAFTGVIPGVPEGGWGTGGFMRGAGPGYYAVAWRVLDARYFGVPQRRRRIFLVATLGNGGCAQILFEPGTMQRHPRESGAEEEDVAATLESCTGGKRTTDCSQTLIVGDSPPAGSGGSQGADPVVYRLQNMGQYSEDDTAGTKQARDFKSPTELVVMGNGSQECGTLCVGGKAAGFAGQDAGNLVVSEKPIAFSCKDHGQDATEDCSPTLRAMSNKEGNANGGGRVAIAFQPSIARGKSQVTCDEAATLAADYDQGDHTQHVAIGLNGRQDPVPSTGESGACDTDGHTQLVAHGRGRRWSIRRLTPREHERLQGFPDDWTLHGIDDKRKPVKLKDGPRYRMTGNACNVRVVEWLAGRIAQHLASL